MKVMKFGGTSVGSVPGILSVKKIVEAETQPVIVVVSALGGITDQLIATSQLAAQGDMAYKQEFIKMHDRHKTIAKEVVHHEQAELSAVLQTVDTMFGELGNIFQGIYLIKDLSDKTLDIIVSYGERLSSFIISHVINDAQLYDACVFIKTNHFMGKHDVNFAETSKLVQQQFAKLPKVAVVPGFISSSADNGAITNLGRGGSDYTASILASELNAEILEIWTDVDGFMTADPRVISNAYVIDELTYVEAMELCNYGAKVIYPPTIYPVYHKNIPTRIRNTFNLESKGTYISRECAKNQEKPIRGISSINDTGLITVQGLGMVGVIGINYRIFKALAKNGVSVFLVAQASSENNTTLGVRTADADRAVAYLKAEFAKELEQGEISNIFAQKGLATVAIVGESMKDTPGVAGKLFDTLGRNGINVMACAQGSSEIHISFVIHFDDLGKALSVIHDSFFLSDYQVLNLFLAGVGTVGHDLLQQIEKQQPRLMEQNSLKINVVGVSNSKRYLFNEKGIDIKTYRDELAKSTNASSPEELRTGILDMNMFNFVFVDCTGSTPLAAIYNDLLSHNVSVVTANKIAASSKYENYLELKQTARRKGVKFLFETNVGAGLPIINTMNALINSGDKINKLEAVLSGTLNFIFNTLSADIPLSKAIVMAKDAGYAEPDPRIDLSGTDVIRKLVILSREAGYKIEQSDVNANLFIPQSCFDGSMDDFWSNVQKLDAEFEQQRKQLQAEGKRLRFVATLNNGNASVGLQEVDARHPFYELEGSNNIILLTTERYKEYPMMIKGYGAGADVTAAGVFADIISIANIR